MKLPVFLFLATLLVGTASAEPAVAPATAAAPATVVNLPSSVTELAHGYATAVAQMSLKDLVIYYKGDRGTTPIKGIRTVRASNGVLIITFVAGDMMAISADSVLMISDGKRAP